MRREFQEELGDELAQVCYNQLIGIYLMSHLCETTHIGMDMSYVSTHSAPSGHGITGLYNSLINEMYLAYSWYLTVGLGLKLSQEAILIRFEQDVYAAKYGDDVVVTCKQEIAHLFNAITYSHVMNDLGIGFTAASKEPHTKPFTPLCDITFLKRHFVAHRQLNDIVGPLDLKVLRATAGHVHDPSRDEEITTAKMDSIQRELFLHPPAVYSEVWSAMTRSYESAFGHKYSGLTELQMYTLYKRGELRSDMFEATAESSFSLPGKRHLRRLVRFN
jgi:hypothetical protein